MSVIMATIQKGKLQIACPGYLDKANSKSFTMDLLSHTKQWRMLNYLRVGIFIAVSLRLIRLFAKLVVLKKG